MTIVQNGTCIIKRLDKRGFGVGDTALGEKALAYTLPGELVEFEEHVYRGQANTITKKILEASAQRIEPKCEYFTRCGGCMLQHFSHDEHLHFKNQMLIELLSTAHINTTISPMIVIEPGMRRRAMLQAVKKNERVFLGFCKFRSDQIVDIVRCPALMRELSDLVMPLKELLIGILLEKEKVSIFINNTSGGIDINIKFKNNKLLDDVHRRVVKSFAERHSVSRVKISAPNINEAIYCATEPYMLVDGVKVSADAECFMQSSKEAENVLQNEVMSHFQDIEEGRAVDLFCGRGTFAIPLSKKCSVDGFESDQSAVTALSKACLNMNVTLRDLYTSPLTQQELELYQYVIINPPRQGAKAQCVNIAQSNARKVVYVSCNPESFANDAKILINGGYRLTVVTPIDQFYWNYHLEVVGLFECERLK